MKPTISCHVGSIVVYSFDSTFVPLPKYANHGMPFFMLKSAGDCSCAIFVSARSNWLPSGNCTT
ncbi:MAG: hypothetical protein LOD92_07995, partial [Bacillales bacterium]